MESEFETQPAGQPSAAPDPTLVLPGVSSMPVMQAVPGLNALFLSQSASVNITIDGVLATNAAATDNRLVVSQTPAYTGQDVTTGTIDLVTGAVDPATGIIKMPNLVGLPLHAVASMLEALKVVQAAQSQGASFSTEYTHVDGSKVTGPPWPWDPVVEGTPVPTVQVSPTGVVGVVIPNISG